MAMPRYQGIPLDRLRIDAVDWTHRAEHIRQRSQRKGQARDFDVEPEWATEAALDPERLIALGSRSSIRVIGMSPSARRLLKVFLVAKNLEEGEWWGATAMGANDRDLRRYEQRT